MPNNEIIPSAEDGLSLIPESLAEYLESHGLPTENVLVPFEERAAVRTNLPAIVARLGDRAADAVYVSKFIVASAVGLFDAALNYLWNETVQNLRAKVERFDLEYFYDTAVPSTERRKFKDASDLPRLEDWVLIVGSRDTGIISELGFKHLDYIRDMRNWASAAHPNQNEITGLQLSSWLDTCIKEVINKEPDSPVIEVRKLLRNIRERTLDEESAQAVRAAVKTLPSNRAGTLLNSMFGMYIDERLSAQVRTNINYVSESVWDCTTEDYKYEVGLKLESMSANGDVERAKLARSFLESVNGLGYLSEGSLALEMLTAVENLYRAHVSFNNFYLEAEPANQVRRLIPPNGIIPRAVVPRYVKVIALAAIGNRYGVSWAADSHYNEIVKTWSDEHATVFLGLVTDSEISRQLESAACADRFKSICLLLRDQVSGSAVRSALDIVSRTDARNVSNLAKNTAFRALLEAK